MDVTDSPGGRLARRIVARLRAAGHEAFLVGGCVRDLLLGTTPKDFDVATSTPPDRVRQLFPRNRLVGAHFGVVLVRENGEQVEVATFRRDHTYDDGRHPVKVDFETDPRQDVLRRDFTINALLLDPATGEVLDFVEGRKDLSRGVIRTVGDPKIRFGEDHLRMLRAVRFAARLNYAIEPATRSAIRRLRERVRLVAAERVRDELIRILTEGGARHGFELLEETGLLEEILPEVAAMKDVAQPPQFHPEGDVWTHTLLMLEAVSKPSATLALGLLLHDVGKPPTFRVAERIRFDNHSKVGAEIAVRILSRLRCSREQIRQVEALVANHLRFMDVRQMKASTLKRFFRLERFEEHLELHRLDCLASHGHLENYEFAKAKFEELPPEKLEPAPLITGDDLIGEGYRPGPAFGHILETVETAQLESRIQTSEDALALVRSLFSPPDGRLRSADT